jgi:hypothetical protein
VQETGSAWVAGLTDLASGNEIIIAMDLSEKHGLKGYDSIQLATALELQTSQSSTALLPLIFVSADDKLNTAAQAEGLIVENPNNHP